MIRLFKRWRCHGTTICCQHVDLATCNSPMETHRRGRRNWIANYGATR